MERIVRGTKLAGVEKPEYVCPHKKKLVTYDGDRMYIDGVDIAKMPSITGTYIHSGCIYGPIVEADGETISDCMVRILNDENKKRSRWL